ncbi:hypothetical protein Nepgr_033464 [Nepenthes gracilis]|uniref:Uncharacterized protein n=1 Tax=Nepenthes gracilis TaxID=150966 RepID=A0AAD3Y8E3_NEPGR|nr:hypothetical protein Nepgr_033464 [Nepenthes gracilis]
MSRIPGAYSTSWYPARLAAPPPSTHMWNQSIVTVTKKTKMGFSPINPKRACANGQRLDLLKKRIASTTC